MTKTLTLANSVTANTTGASVTFDGDSGYANIYLSGSFGGASVKIESQPGSYSPETPSVGFVAVSGAENMTSPTVKKLEIPKNTKLRCVISGVSVSTNITVVAHYDKESYFK